MTERLPRQARAIATRSAVVDAAVGLLAGEGLAGTRTAAVARAAGVSQGALFRYFPTKDALLAAATERVLDDLLVQFVAALAGPAPKGGRLRPGLHALWSIYRDPRLTGVFELFLAARTDPSLAEALAPVVAAHAARERQLARQIFPEAAQREDFDALVSGLLSMLQGAAVAAAVVPDLATGGIPVELAFMEALVRRELGEPVALEGR